jgi:hypothetical protein
MHHPLSASYRVSVRKTPVVRFSNLSLSEGQSPQFRLQTTVFPAQTPVLGAQGINTHYYDGILCNLRHLIQSDLDRVASINKSSAFEDLSRIVSAQNPCPQTTMCLNAIIQTYITHGRGGENYDPKNDMYACDLLYIVYERIIRKDEMSPRYLEELLIQLEDMATGLCEQGRTTRLFQILVML